MADGSILVLGATGTIGREMVAQLVQAGRHFRVERAISPRRSGCSVE
jgi:uncharacterized protein YbjT (DUF2867 family)